MPTPEKHYHPPGASAHPIVEFRRRLHLAIHRSTSVTIPRDLAMAIDKYLPQPEYVPDLWQGRRQLVLRRPWNGCEAHVISIDFQLPVDDDGRADESHLPSEYTYNRQRFVRAEPDPKDPPPHYFIVYRAAESAP